jgi:hypothetical protein
MDAEMTVRSNRAKAVAVDLLAVVVAVGMAVAAPPLGSMSHAKFATKRGITPRSAGPDTPMMMTMSTRKFPPPMTSTQIGSKTRVPHTISQESSII